MKESHQLKPNFAPVYAAALYPDLARLAQSCGYALAVHGSVARDFDLIAVPWAEKVSDRQTLLDLITKTFSIRISPDSPVIRNHGRVAYTLICGFGECQIDLSFI